MTRRRGHRSVNLKPGSHMSPTSATTIVYGYSSAKSFVIEWSLTMTRRSAT